MLLPPASPRGDAGLLPAAPGRTLERARAAAPKVPRAIGAAGRALVRILPAGAPPPGRGAGPLGLGFLVDRRGYVLTHQDLVVGAGPLQVVLADGRRLRVAQVWKDPLTAVAVLKLDGDRLPALPLGESRDLRVGDPGFLVGWPSDGAPPVHAATIQATGSAIGGDLALDAALARAESGGPLLDVAGNVVGIAVAEAQPPGDARRPAFAIPIDRAKAILRTAQASRTDAARPSRFAPSP
jgi:S1-C subfamily serine protease